MNKLPNWKISLIKWLIGDEPVMMNVTIFAQNKWGMNVIMVPPESERMAASYYEQFTFIVPTRNIER